MCLSKKYFYLLMIVLLLRSSIGFCADATGLTQSEKIAPLINYLFSSDLESEVVYSKLIQFRGDDYNSRMYGGSFAQRTDGKFLVSYQIDNKIMLSVVDTENELLTKSNSGAEKEWVFYSLYSNSNDIGGSNQNSILQKLNNGSLLLYIVEQGSETELLKPFEIKVFKSNNGLGTDFSQISSIYKQNLNEYFPNILSHSSYSAGQPIQVENQIILPITVPTLATIGIDSVIIPEGYSVHSFDGGITWQFDRIKSYDGGYNDPYMLDVRGIGVLGNQLVTVVSDSYAHGSSKFYVKNLNDPLVHITGHNYANNWRGLDDYVAKRTNDMLYSNIFYTSLEYTYLLYNDAEYNLPSDIGNGYSYWVYRRKNSLPLNTVGQNPYSMGPIGSGATWEGPLNSTRIGDDNTEHLLVTPSGHLVVLGTSYFAQGAVSHLIPGYNGFFKTK